jgi:hypothetical protein
MGRSGKIALFTVAFLIAAAAGPARADAPGATVALPVAPLAPAPPATVWYGWKPLTVDLAALGAAYACDKTNWGPACFGAFMGYIMVPPIMHIHHSGWRSMGSLALRIGLPIVGWLATLDLHCMSDHSAPSDGTCNDGGNGFIGGVVAAMIIDDLFAFDEVTPTAPTPAPRAAPHAVSLAPTFALTRGTAGLGLAGSF